MPAYVPPQRRGQNGDDSKGRDQSETVEPEKERERDFAPSSSKGYSKGRSKGGGQPPKTGGGGYRSLQGEEQGNWWDRRPGGETEEEKSELEVFGEPKARATTGIEFDKYDAIPVNVSGQNVEQKAITRFSEAKLVDSLFDNLRRCGYERPTPVQKHSIPLVVAGRDVMACAQTGSGKTCAFMVPCLQSLLISGPPPPPNTRSRPPPMPCALVLAPTRELAMQIHVETLKFAYGTGIRACIVYGGEKIYEQKDDLRKGCDVLIATPGRLTDMHQRRHVSLELVQFFILDEADRMLDMGFEPQVRQIVDNTDLGSRSMFPRQSMMFSATFAHEVQLMAQDFLHDYVFISIGRVGAAAETVRQIVLHAQTEQEKTNYLGKLFKEHLPKDGLCIIFVETKKAADELEVKLHEGGHGVTAIHGDRSQELRTSALAAFKSGELPILVATDVAARGLDIPNVALVINFDLPKQLDDYIHRIGRTGRAGRKGVAVSFVNDRCNFLPALYNVLVEAKQDPPEWFEELIRRSGGPRRVGGKGGKSERFGGEDMRETAENKASKGNSSVARREAPRAEASSTGYGNSGAEDAW